MYVAQEVTHAVDIIFVTLGKVVLLTSTKLSSNQT